MLLDFTIRRVIHETFLRSVPSFPLLVQMEFPTLNLFHSREERKHNTEEHERDRNTCYSFRGKKNGRGGEKLGV